MPVIAEGFLFFPHFFKFLNHGNVHVVHGILVFLILNWKNKPDLKTILISGVLFLVTLSPLLIFDIRHNWMNSKALYKFVTVRDETQIGRPLGSIAKTYPIFEQVNSSMLTAKLPVGRFLTLIMIAWVIFFVSNKKVKFKTHSQYYLLLTWFLVGLVGLGLYKQEIYDHYFGFLFPVPFLLFCAMVSNRLERKSKLISLFVWLVVVYLVILNLKNSPLLKTPNNQMQRSRNVSSKVLEIADGKPFNLAVLAERNYEDGYRYFMDIKDAKVLHADIWDKSTISYPLIVICEKPKEKCDLSKPYKLYVSNMLVEPIEINQ